MSWSVAQARARLSELLDAAAHQGPQPITNRGRPVAVVVSAEEYAAFREWRERPDETLADALREVSELCAEEGYSLEPPPRRDRPDAFARPRR